jgi:hypothetical protein
MVATGTFAGPVSCGDSQHNSYSVVADQSGGSGRLFVCASNLAKPLTTSDTVSASYPGFSGVSVLAASSFVSTGAIGPVSTSAGSNPPVSSGSITVGPQFLVGVVAHSNVSTFALPPLSDWGVRSEQSGGSGAAKRTVTIMYQTYEFGPPAAFAATGKLSGSGFWQAGIIPFSFA